MLNIIDSSLEALGGSVKSVLSALESGLRSLSFQDNFRSATVDVLLSSTDEAVVLNPFLARGRKEIPDEWIVVDAVASSGGPSIIRGSVWDSERVSFINTTGGMVNVRIRLFLS